jgi:alpha-mannosidase
MSARTVFPALGTQTKDGQTITGVLVLEQYAHLDWDWLNCFPTNVDGSNPIDDTYFGNDQPWKQPANTIYQQANELLQMSSDYFYSTCEMGFLRAFGEANRPLLEAMVTTGRLRIVGGGITSPDNLLSNGEAFFRNYVVGLHWMKSVSLPWTRCVWLPDDFGHDSQLPVQLVAMDALAVGFARCPMAPAYQENMTELQPMKMGHILSSTPPEGGGCDFYWLASDGSQIFAHWMPSSYAQGSRLYGIPGSPPEPLTRAAVQRLLGGYLQQNQPCSPTPYVHVPVASDFFVPLGGGSPTTEVQPTLLNYIAAWNDNHSTVPAVLSTFDQYVEQVLGCVRGDSLRNRTFHGEASSPQTTFRSNPNWMGFYASRMNIKRLHHQATRALLAAETLDAVLTVVASPLTDAASLLAAWDQLAPSTHHDYITGTAVDQVVAQEQIPLLNLALASGTALISAQMQALAASLNPAADALVVFNPLGVARTGTLVEIAPALAKQLALPAAQGQYAAGGNVLVYVTAPSAGYQTFTGDFPASPSPVTCTTPDEGETFILSNGLLSATISRATNWEVSVSVDGSARPFVSGNHLSIYGDSGSIYEFGFECSGTKSSWTPSSCNYDNMFPLLPSNVNAGPAMQTEQGPLRGTVEATIDMTVTVPNALEPTSETQRYTLRYSLVAGEPFLRMTVIGQAPANTSVFTSFTFTQPIVSLEHGTPYHWDYKEEARFGTSADWDAVFEPTHDFVSAWSADGLLGTIYHLSVPPWAMNGNQLVGAILRNTPGACDCDGRGAEGNDNGLHVIEYALRIPHEMGAASTGQPLQEARAYNTPLYTAVASPSAGSAPLVFSLAEVAAPPAAMITAIKRGTFDDGELFVRVYVPISCSPTTFPPVTPLVPVTVTVACNTAGAVVATALEQIPSSTDPMVVEPSNGQFSFKTARAITTVRLPSP